MIVCFVVACVCTHVHAHTFAKLVNVEEEKKKPEQKYRKQNKKTQPKNSESQITGVKLATTRQQLLSGLIKVSS